MKITMVLMTLANLAKNKKCENNFLFRIKENAAITITCGHLKTTHKSHSSAREQKQHLNLTQKIHL